MSGRGVITSRTSVSPKSTIDWSSLRSIALDEPWSSAGIVARPGVAVFGSRGAVAGGSVRSRLPSAVMSFTSGPVSGWRNLATTSNGGSSTSSTRSGLRRTISSGSTCAQTRMNKARKTSSRPIDWSPARPVEEHDEHRRQRENDPEEEPCGEEQLDRIVEIEPEAVGAAAAFRHQAEREAHEGAEGRLDDADVDSGNREQEQEKRAHGRDRSIRPAASPPFRRRRASSRAIRPLSFVS